MDAWSRYTRNYIGRVLSQYSAYKSFLPPNLPYVPDSGVSEPSKNPERINHGDWHGGVECFAASDNSATFLIFQSASRDFSSQRLICAKVQPERQGKFNMLAHFAPVQLRVFRDRYVGEKAADMLLIQSERAAQVM